ncbi:MAG: hypothetical protein ACRD0K_15850 [Egibacteraceae bacterium]
MRVWAGTTSSWNSLHDLVEHDVAVAVRAVIGQRHVDLLVDLFRFGWQPSGLLPVALAGFAARCGRIRFLLTSGERCGLPFAGPACLFQPVAQPGVVLERTGCFLLPVR